MKAEIKFKGIDWNQLLNSLTIEYCDRTEENHCFCRMCRIGGGTLEFLISDEWVWEFDLDGSIRGIEISAIEYQTGSGKGYYLVYPENGNIVFYFEGRRGSFLGGSEVFTLSPNELVVCYDSFKVQVVEARFQSSTPENKLMGWEEFELELCGLDE